MPPGERHPPTCNSACAQQMPGTVMSMCCLHCWLMFWNPAQQQKNVASVWTNLSLLVFKDQCVLAKSDTEKHFIYSYIQYSFVSSIFPDNYKKSHGKTPPVGFGENCPVASSPTPTFLYVWCVKMIEGTMISE